MALDFSPWVSILPLLSAAVFFIVCFVVLGATKLIEAKSVRLLLSFLLCIIFLTASGPMELVAAFIPWFAVLIVGLFLILMLGGFATGKSGSDITKNVWIGRVFITLLGLSFFISAIFILFSYYQPYLPGSSGYGSNPLVRSFIIWLTSPKVAGFLLLLGLGTVVSLILTKAK